MMKIYRVHFCKMVLLLLLAIGCSKDQPLMFCEGVNKDGEPVQCGTKFTTGDMTLFIKAKEPFGSNTATVVVYEKKEYSQPEYTRFEYTINPDLSQATIPLSLYAEGTYIVSIIVKDKEIAKGTVTIVDTY